MTDRSWTDQPKELEEAEVVLSTHMDFPSVGGLGVEIRLRGSKFSDTRGQVWYLTTGNLFGSQTVKCLSAESVLRCLNTALKADESGVSAAAFGELMRSPLPDIDPEPVKVVAAPADRKRYERKMTSKLDGCD